MEVIKQKLGKRNVLQGRPSLGTKEDEVIADKAMSDVNVTAADKTLKDSMTFSKSNADLLPKLNQDMNSVRSSRDKDFTKDDDSGEI